MSQCTSQPSDNYINFHLTNCCKNVAVLIAIIFWCIHHSDTTLTSSCSSQNIANANYVYMYQKLFVKSGKSFAHSFYAGYKHIAENKCTNDKDEGKMTGSKFFNRKQAADWRITANHIAKCTLNAI